MIMLKKTPLVSLIALILISAAAVLDIESSHAAPIFSPSPRTQFFQGTAFRAFGKFQRFEGGGNKLDAWTVPAIFSYAPVADASLTLTVPYVDKHFETSNQTYDAHGLGDMTLLGKYRFYRRDLPFGRDQIAVLGGLELPTGSTQKGPGIQAAPPLQLGSGSVDTIIGIAASTTRKKYSIETALRGKINSEAKDVRFGNVLFYDLAFAYQLYPAWPKSFSQLNLLIELNGRTSGDNEIGDETRPTGGTVLFVSPGIQYILNQNFLVEIGAQLPVVQDFPDQALEPGYSLLWGARYIF